MPHLAHVVVAGGTAAAAVARLEALNAAGFAGLAVSNGLDVADYVRGQQPDILLFGGDFADVDSFEVARSLKNDETTAHVPIMMLNAPAAADARRQALEAGIDDLVDGVPELDVIVERMRPLLRLSTMHAELRRRTASAAAFGANVDCDYLAHLGTAGSRLLLVGGSPSTAEGIARTLQSTGFDVTREADPYSAGEIVERERMDGAIVVVEEKPARERCLYFCAHLRNNPSLFNLPVLFVSNQERGRPSVEPYARGASVVLPLTPIDLDAIETQMRVLVRRQRLRWKLRDPILATLQPATCDELQGIYSREFLDRHLGALIAAGSRRRRNLAVALFSIQNAPGVEEQYGKAARASLLQQTADWVSGLVRVEDMTARVDAFNLCAVFPDTRKADAARAAHRIAGVLHHSDFQVSQEANRPIRVWVQTGIAAAEQDDDVDSLLARARSNLE